MSRPRFKPALAALAAGLALTAGALTVLALPASGSPHAATLADAARSQSRTSAPAFAQAPALPDKSLALRAERAASAATLAHAFHANHVNHLRLVALRRAEAQAAARAAAARAAELAYARAHPVAHPARIITAPVVKAPSGGGSSGGGCSDPSGQLTQSQVGMLWLCAGGPSYAEGAAEAISHCESGWNTFAHNPSGATGLFQILGSVVSGSLYDAHVNALNAVSKFRASGNSWSQWVCRP